MADQVRNDCGGSEVLSEFSDSAILRRGELACFSKSSGKHPRHYKEALRIILNNTDDETGNYGVLTYPGINAGESIPSGRVEAVIFNGTAHSLGRKIRTKLPWQKYVEKGKPETLEWECAERITLK
jgi:hypothetical protein